MPKQTDPTLTLADLAAEYRDNAETLASNAAESEALAARGYRPGYHSGYAKVCRREAADWAALADVVSAAARRSPRLDEGDQPLAAAARRLAARLETTCAKCPAEWQIEATS